MTNGKLPHNSEINQQKIVNLQTAEQKLNNLEIIKQYFDNIVPEQLQVLLSDEDFRTIYCTESYTRVLFGFERNFLINENLKNIDNKYVQGILKNVTHYLALWKKLRPRHLWVLVTMETPLGKHTFFVEITYVNLVGYKCILTNVHFGVFIEILLNINKIMKTRQKTKDGTSRKPCWSLTETEESIIFLLSIGKSFKEISNILTKVYNEEYSDKQIQRIVHNHLFEKFNVFSTVELIDVYLNTTRMTVIPDKLLSSNEIGLLSYIPIDAIM